MARHTTFSHGKEGEFMAEYIEVGFTALRDPATGEFLPAVPLYIEKTSAAVADEAALVKDLGKLFAHKMKSYMESTQTATAQAQKGR